MPSSASSDEPSADGGQALTPETGQAAAADVGRSTRHLTGPWGRIVGGLAVAYSGYYLYTAQFGIASPQAHRGLYWGFAATLTFLLYPLRGTAHTGESRRIPIWDVALALLAVGLTAYYVLGYQGMVARASRLNDTDIVLGILAVAVSLELARRTVGWTLTALGALAIIYSFMGPSMPGPLVHRGYDLQRFLSTQYTSFNGIFGPVADIFATFVFVFIIFGAFLNRSGAGQFFIDLPLAVAGTKRGGPAKVAVAVSALMGSVNGSPVANVMTTGSFTIPMMRRTGYSKEFAGGVEAAASVGGQMLPPVMGAGAFLIAEFTRTPYLTIVLVSIVPALLYFLAVYLLVDFRAQRRNLQGLPASELPDWKVVVKEGWYFVIPLILLMTLIIMRYSPAFAGFWAIVSVVVIGVAVPYRGHRMTWRDMLGALRDGAVSSLTVGAIVGVIGIIIGVVNLTGLGLRFSDLIVQASGGSLLAGLVLVTLASWVLGAGLTVTSSYIMVAILAAPALTDLGISLLAAHLIVFWVSQDANVTPPICLAAFAAASISGGSPMKTGLEAWKLARGLYIVPFLMAYTALIDGPWQDAAPSVLAAVVGIYLLCAGISGWLLHRTSWYDRGLLLVGGVLLIAPGWLNNGLGVAVGIVAFLLHRFVGGGVDAQPASASA